MPAHGSASPFVPVRLFLLPEYLALPVGDRWALLAAYGLCDRWGRGGAHPATLNVTFGLPTDFDMRAAIERLAAAGLMLLYSVEGRDYWQLVGFDADAPAEVKRRRQTSSQFPPPPDDDASPPGIARQPLAGPSEVEHSRSSPGNVGAGKNALSWPMGLEGVVLGWMSRHARRGDTADDIHRIATAYPAVFAAAVAAAPERDSLDELRARCVVWAQRNLERQATKLASLDWPPGTQAVGQRWLARLLAERPDLEFEAMASVCDIAAPSPMAFSAAADEMLAHGADWAHGDPLEQLAKLARRKSGGFAPRERAPSKARRQPNSDADAWWVQFVRPEGLSETDWRAWPKAKRLSYGVIAGKHPNAGQPIVEHPSLLAKACIRQGVRVDDVMALVTRTMALVTRTDAREARGTRETSSDDVPVVHRPREPFRGWAWSWDSMPDGTPIDQTWPSALDLPYERHAAMAWVTHTPDGPVTPPKRLVEVPGATDAYRGIYGGDGGASP